MNCVLVAHAQDDWVVIRINFVVAIVERKRVNVETFAISIRREEFEHRARSLYVHDHLRSAAIKNPHTNLDRIGSTHC